MWRSWFFDLRRLWAQCCWWSSSSSAPSLTRRPWLGCRVFRRQAGGNSLRRRLCRASVRGCRRHVRAWLLRLLLDSQTTLKCLNGLLQVVHHLKLLEDSLVGRGGGSEGGTLWGSAGSKIGVHSARRPVVRWQLAISTVPIGAGAASRHNATRTNCIIVANDTCASRRSQ